MIDIVGRVRWIRDKANNIFDMVNAILTLTQTGGTITTDGTEQDVYINETPMGNYKTIKLRIDFTNQTAAERILLKLYYRIAPGGAYVEKDRRLFEGVLEEGYKLINVELEPVRHGIKVTMQRLAGAALTYPFEVFYEV